MSNAAAAAWGWLAGDVVMAFFLALGVVRAAIAYAHRRGMFDQPGQRRSHTVPTPRGGGIGIVAAVVLTAPLCLWSVRSAWPAYMPAAWIVAVLLVAWIGWWDDHRPLPALPRFAVQMLAVALFSAALLLDGPDWRWLPLLVLAGAWSINLHNFMDGIDGLLAQQGVFAACGMALLAGFCAQPALAGASACIAAACLGFWCFNRSPARIFMGDVGSGSLGLLVFVVAAMLWKTNWLLLWACLILSSAFVTDATLTLLTRILRGRRWYTPHREHLYQWIVRNGSTHAAAAAWYFGWNLLVAAPLAAWAFEYPGMGLAACVLAYSIAVAVWFVVKRRLIRRDRYKVRHVHT